MGLRIVRIGGIGLLGVRWYVSRMVLFGVEGVGLFFCLCLIEFAIVIVDVDDGSLLSICFVLLG